MASLCKGERSEAGAENEKTDGLSVGFFISPSLRVKGIFEGFPEFENGLFAGGNLDLFFGLRVDAGLGGHVLDLEGTESDELNFVPGFERFRHRRHECVVSDRRILVGEAGFLRHSLDKFAFVHKSCPLCLDSRGGVGNFRPE